MTDIEAQNSHLPKAARRWLLGDDRGENIIEFALASTVFFTTIFGIIIFGIGVWQYNMVSDLAQEGARWASVHGSTQRVAGGPGRGGDLRPEPRAFHRDGYHDSDNSGRIRIDHNGARPTFVRQDDLIAARWARESGQRCADDRLPVNSGPGRDFDQRRERPGIGNGPPRTTVRSRVDISYGRQSLEIYCGRKLGCAIDESRIPTAVSR